MWDKLPGSQSQPLAGSQPAVMPHHGCLCVLALQHPLAMEVQGWGYVILWGMGLLWHRGGRVEGGCYRGPSCTLRPLENVASGTPPAPGTH